jgi:hypothetical protein
MNDDDKVKPVQFQWSSDDMSMTSVVAQEIDSIDLSGISITDTGLSPSYYINSSVDTITIGPSSFSSISTSNSNEVSANYIQTPKHRIDLDELAEVFETVKKRLLILTPNFEMHEKYPMLKELYDEYKALEALLSGPDKSVDQ